MFSAFLDQQLLNILALKNKNIFFYITRYYWLRKHELSFVFRYGSAINYSDMGLARAIVTFLEPRWGLWILNIKILSKGIIYSRFMAIWNFWKMHEKIFILKYPSGSDLFTDGWNLTINQNKKSKIQLRFWDTKFEIAWILTFPYIISWMLYPNMPFVIKIS